MVDGRFSNGLFVGMLGVCVARGLCIFLGTLDRAPVWTRRKPPENLS